MCKAAKLREEQVRKGILLVGVGLAYFKHDIRLSYAVINVSAHVACHSALKHRLFNGRIIGVGQHRHKNFKRQHFFALAVVAYHAGI